MVYMLAFIVFWFFCGFLEWHVRISLWRDLWKKWSHSQLKNSGGLRYHLMSPKTKTISYTTHKISLRGIFGECECPMALHFCSWWPESNKSMRCPLFWGRASSDGPRLDPDHTPLTANGQPDQKWYSKKTKSFKSQFEDSWGIPPHEPLPGLNTASNNKNCLPKITNKIDTMACDFPSDDRKFFCDSRGRELHSAKCLKRN